MFGTHVIMDVSNNFHYLLSRILCIIMNIEKVSDTYIYFTKMYIYISMFSRVRVRMYLMGFFYKEVMNHYNNYDL